VPQRLEKPRAYLDPDVEVPVPPSDAKAQGGETVGAGVSDGQVKSLDPGEKPEARKKSDAGVVTERKDAAQPRSAGGWRALIFTAIGVILVAAAAAGLIWWLNARHYESTDDAFIDARNVSVSSQINGAIVDVPVSDNQTVDAGAILARIDNRDYRAAVDQAKAQIDQAHATMINLDAQVEAQQARIDQAEKQVAQAEAALSFAHDEDVRAQDLVKKGAGSLQRAQQTASDLRQRQAALAAAQANLVAVQKQIAVLKTQREIAAAQREQAQAAKDLADANLARTVIAAPTAGLVTRLTAAKGAYAQAGQSLMMFVPRDIWITANYKETQLTDMRPGQEVTIYIDAYPGRIFRGHVDSIQAGSGAAFAVLPPENATGNYVKVVQRVPVKIVFDAPPDVYLGPGMSVVPEVKVR
jgi:membrane fusion protein, multidrug efflux system